MPGIAETFSDRKAYFQSLRDSEPSLYVKLMQETNAKMAKLLGKSESGSSKTGENLERTRLLSAARNAEERSRASSVTGMKQFAALQASSEKEIKAVHSTSTAIKNAILGEKLALSTLLKKQVALLEKIAGKIGSQGAGLPFDLDPTVRKPVPGPASGKPRGKVGRALGAIKAAGKKVLSPIAGAIGTAAKTGGALVRAAGPTAAKLAGPALALGLAAKESYDLLSDKNKSTKEKGVGTAGIAGGTAGALALGSVGAAVGTAILPGIGTAIGGLGGSIAGYLGGEKIATSIGTSITSAVERSGLGDAVGMGAAAVMAPFSAEAREALVTDFNKHIIPSFQGVFSGLSDKFERFSTNLSDTFTDVAGPIKDAASNLKSGFIKAIGQVKTGYQEGGLPGAVRAVPKAAETVGTTFKESKTKLDPAFTAIGSRLGAVSEKYESGGRGVGTVSTGKGDFGGVSYGKYQLATNNGSISKFLASEEGKKYGAQFAGLKPGSAEFNERYKAISKSDASGFEEAQHSYIQKTHYAPAAQKLRDTTGIDVSKLGKAAQEAVFSTSVQYGAGSSVLKNAFKGVDPKTLDDATFVKTLQDYKASTVGQYFKSSSPAVQASIAKRAASEKETLLGIADITKNPNNKTLSKEAMASVGILKPDTPVKSVPNSSVGSVAPAKETAFMTDASYLPTKKNEASMSASSTMGRGDSSGPSTMSAPTSTNSYRQPITMVARNAPPEVPLVRTQSADPISTPERAPTLTQTSSIQGRSPSAFPDLSDIPVFFPEMGLVPLLLGKA